MEVSKSKRNRAPVLLTQQDSQGKSQLGPDSFLVRPKKRIFNTYSEPSGLKFIQKKSRDKRMDIGTQMNSKVSMSGQLIAFTKDSFKKDEECKSAGLKPGNKMKNKGFMIKLSCMDLKPTINASYDIQANDIKTALAKKKISRLGSFSDHGERSRKNLQNFNQMTRTERSHLAR